MKLALIISPNWGNYGQQYLEACLASVIRQSRLPDKLFLIDNESSDDSLSFLREMVDRILADSHLPVEIVTLEHNAGFAGGNNAAMEIALKEGFDYIALFNMDGRLADDCLAELLKAADCQPAAGAIQARVMLWPDTQVVNSLGNATHFLGFGYCQGYRQTIDSDELVKINLSPIAYPSGAAVLLKSSALQEVGLFDEVYWMYNEDQDLGWRLWLAGYEVILAADAVFYHQYEFSRSISKYYWMDRNRLVSILKHYRWPTLLLILPALLVMELGLLYGAAKGGWLKEKFKVWYYFCKPSTWRYIRQSRQQSKTLRRLSDRLVVCYFSGRISYQEINSPALGLANKFFQTYWRLVRPLIIW